MCGEGLGLDALGGVDEEEGTLAGGEGTGDFIGEIDVAGGVDEVEEVVEVVFGVPVDHGGGLGLDGDAAFAFDLEGVGVLRFGFLFCGGDVAFCGKGGEGRREGGRVDL